MPINQVRVHHLHKGDNKERTLYRLEKGWVLRFLLGPSLHSRTVRIFCNHPPDPKILFDRHVYHELEWRCPTGMRSDLTDVFAELEMVTSGSFNYFFTIDESTAISNCDGQGFFLVDPVLPVGQGEELSMGCLQVQTVITKLLGPFPQWESRLAVSRETGFNMLHFTPVQELGISNSAYSIRDQLRFSPVYSPDQRALFTMTDLEALVKKMHVEWRVLSMTDLVFNHTAKDSPWLWEHPECAYTMSNTPHLRPAYMLDRILRHFSREVAQGKWQEDGVPANFNSMEHIDALGRVLREKIFPKYKLSEYFMCHVDDVIRDFKKASQDNRAVQRRDDELRLSPGARFVRHGMTVDMNHALYTFNTDRDCTCEGEPSPNVFAREERVEKCCEALRTHLHQLNQRAEWEVLGHVDCAIKNYQANAKYRFVDQHGPRLGTVTPDEPLMHDYFVAPDSHDGDPEKAEDMMNREPHLIMAVNGWVMGDNPLRNFAEEGDVFIRRELVAWGDSVKLRYGKKPSDSPYLWERMQRYAEITARIFHGIRLDNCHSTPIHVAEHMLDAARKIRPDLYVVAELFTGSDDLDNLFMNRLGINSLIREAMSACDIHDQGRLVHRFGGVPVGSFAQPRVRPLVPTVAHALFFDQTHDNESPIQKRSVYDLWATAGLIAMADCAIGSNRGYDHLVPHHIHVVEEERLYPKWANIPSPNAQCIDLSMGIGAGRQALNNLHYEMAREGYKEVFVDQLCSDVIAVTRHNPQTHSWVVLVSRMCWEHPGNPKNTVQFRPVEVHGVVEEVMFEGCLLETPDVQYQKDSQVINGLPNYYLDLRKNIPIANSQFCFEESAQGSAIKKIFFQNFVPGAVVVFRCGLTDTARCAILDLRRNMGSFGYLMRSYSGNTTFDESWDKSNFRVIVSRLTLQDLNRVQYRTDQEERDDMFGLATYNIPNHGNLCYSGLRGVMSTLGEIRPHNDLGHPLCQNLREGDWLPDYIANRLKKIGNTLHLGDWFESMFKHMKKIPRYLVPCYFDAVVTGAYICLREMALQQFSDFVRDGSTFVQALALGSTQFCGFVRTARLPPLSPHLREPKPRVEVNMDTNQVEEAPVSLAAGLPHFAAGIWRNWGRDTFIALRGMLLVTSRFNEARMLILAYGGVLRHGLIPNLLSNGGENPRYNCRDAVWWWLHAIQAFVRFAPKGEDLLSDKVSRIFPTDDSPPRKAGECDQPLHVVMQEALTRHMSGIQFRERGAGPSIDEHMSDEGFNMRVGINWPRGYPCGGNVHNCGTWMDKMGSSSKSGNKGKPATPRDGCAVELVGLCASTVYWLAALSRDKVYPYEGVTVTDGDFKDQFISFQQWFDAIRDNFEKDFYIDTEPRPENEPNPELIHRRGIYKDCFNATLPWTNFQLRPNFPIAMVVAPVIFDPRHAWTALDMAEKILLGPLGMKTLDPKDWSYNGDYHITDDSDDPSRAGGHNYHNGPEWVWPIAYFLRAKLYFASKLEKHQPGILRQTVDFVDKVLCKHYQELMNSPWKSLPELTNTDGSFCADSCRAQAWSDGCILEVLYDLERIEIAQRPSIVDFQGNIQRYK